MSNFLDKLRGLPPERKTQVAIIGSVFITLIVLIFYIVGGSVFDKKEDKAIKQSLFDTKKFKEIKNSFNNLFK